MCYECAGKRYTAECNYCRNLYYMHDENCLDMLPTMFGNFVLQTGSLAAFNLSDYICKTG